MIFFLKHHFQKTLIIFLFIVAYIPIFIWMYDRWIEPESYYSHGLLVPLVSLFLIWDKRYVLRNIVPVPSPWGIRLFLLGIIIYWFSASLNIYFTAGFSMLMVMVGLILHFYGTKALNEILFPILFLLFMIPLPLIFVASVSFKLKILAAQLATMILNNIRLPAEQISSIIKMQHSYVIVEDACGGLKSLISLTALGSLFAFNIKSGLFKKILLFSMAIPIAVIANAGRIVFLAAVGEIWGVEYTQGFLHFFSGYLVFVFSFLFLLAIKQLLE